MRRLFVTILLLLIVWPCLLKAVAKDTSYQITLRDSDATYLQLVFVDSLLKKELSDAITIKLIDLNGFMETKEILQNYDSNHAPIPIKVLPGRYKLFNKDLIAEEIDIVANKLNSMRVYLKWPTLQFRYRVGQKLASNYVAKVTRRFNINRTVLQQCNHDSTYQPGEYYIEINTLPVYKASIGMLYDQVYEIQIGMPCSIKLQTFDESSEIVIQCWRGEQWMDLPINANDVSIYPLTVLPGNYKVIWKFKGKSYEKQVALRDDQHVVVACNKL